MTKKFAIFLAVVFMLASSQAFAAELPSSEWTKAGTKSEKSWQKLHFGLKNATLGWTEILTEPYEAIQASNTVMAPVNALGEGVFNAILDTTGGVAQLATFPCSAIDFPLPEGGTDLHQVLTKG